MRKVTVAAVASVSVLALLPATGVAQPVQVAAERTDNEFSFTYDEANGEIGTATSSRETRAGDDVSFEVFIVEADGAGPGLLGKLKLRLDGDQHTVYDGWFSLKVGSGGSVYYQRLRPAEIHLRPRPGQRTATITFRFDLPTGNYRATGTFESE